MNGRRGPLARSTGSAGGEAVRRVPVYPATPARRVAASMRAPRSTSVCASSRLPTSAAIMSGSCPSCCSDRRSFAPGSLATLPGRRRNSNARERQGVPGESAEIFEFVLDDRRRSWGERCPWRASRTDKWRRSPRFLRRRMSTTASSGIGLSIAGTAMVSQPFEMPPQSFPADAP